MKNDLRRILKVGLVAGCLLSPKLFSVAWSYEVDNFSERSLDRKDALEVMDREVNRILDRAARETNLESKRYCSFAHLRQEILRWIRPDPTGILEIWANNTTQIQQTGMSYKNSIYGDVTLLDSPALWIVGIGASMKLNGVMTGTDKIGHFFMQGLDYFDRVKSGKPIDQVLLKDHGEDGVWGLTGIKSYADMAANYSGFLFWSNLVQGDHRYFKCEYEKGWVKQRAFSWKDYVTDAWDEGINCSEMTATVQQKVNQRMQKLRMSCPTEDDKCAKLGEHEKAEFVIHPKCRTRTTSLANLQF